MKLRVLLLILSVSFTALLFAAEPTDDYLNKAIKEYETLNAMLNQTLVSPSGCSSAFKMVNKSDLVCSFDELCEKLSETGDEFYLYKNNNNERLVNWNLLKLQKKAQSCYQEIRGDALNGINQEMRGKLLTMQNRTRLNALEKLEDHFQSNPDDKTFYDELVQSSLDSIFTPLGGDTTVRAMKMELVVVKNRDYYDKLISKFEQKQGKALTPEGKERLLSFLALESAQAEGRLLSDGSKQLDLDYRRMQESIPTLPPLKGDPFWSPDQFDQEDELVKEKQRVALERFKTIKNEVIMLIGKSKSKYGEEQYQNIVKRIEALTIDFDYFSDEACIQTPNASYNNGDHKIVLCPQILTMPEAILSEILAHEVGHSFDNCMLSYPLRKSEGAYSALNTVSGEVVGESIAQEEHPLKELHQCLAGSDSIGARAPSRDDQLQWVNSEIQRMSQYRDNGLAYSDKISKLQSLKSTLENVTETTFNCTIAGPDGFSQLGEAHADWVASEVISNLYKGDKDKTLEAMGLKSITGCKASQSGVQRQLIDWMKKNGCPTETKSNWDAYPGLLSEAEKTDPHPADSDRIDKIFMANKGIQETLGCPAKEDGARQCEL